MTKAVVTTAFTGRPDNEDRARQIEVGEEIDGDLAKVAIRERWAKPHGPAPKAEPSKSKGDGAKGPDAGKPADGGKASDGGAA